MSNAREREDFRWSITLVLSSRSCKSVGLRKRRPLWIWWSERTMRSHGVNSILRVESWWLVGRIVLIERKRTMLICFLQKLWKEVDVICKTSCIFILYIYIYMFFFFFFFFFFLTNSTCYHCFWKLKDIQDENRGTDPPPHSKPEGSDLTNNYLDRITNFIRIILKPTYNKKFQ
jgi:hypothetical protein